MIKQQLVENMRAYMRAKDKTRASGIKMALAAIQNREIELKKELTDEEVIVILKKQVKEHKESLSFIANEDDRFDSEYHYFIEAISKFIPEDMSKEEATGIITKALAEAGVTEKKQKGLAMKTIMPILKGKLDGKVIQEIVDSILI